MRVKSIALALNHYLKNFQNQEKEQQYAKIVAMLPYSEEIIGIGAQHYVEDNQLFLFTSPTYDKETINAKELFDLLEKESADECWRPTSMLDRNHLLSCDMKFYPIDCDMFQNEEIQKRAKHVLYNIVDYDYDVENNQIILTLDI